VVTSSTPFGKAEEKLNPFQMYLSMGVSYIASTMSSQVRPMSAMMSEAMEHPGFAIVHVQSPCTEYNNTYDLLRGNRRKGIPGIAYDIPDNYDETDPEAAFQVASAPGVPLGVVYRDGDRPTFDERIDEISQRAPARSVSDLMNSFTI
jgi:pyruvate/2-oxoacid:ferredoxin oxidoreductase beta subunit